MLMNPDANRTLAFLPGNAEPQIRQLSSLEMLQVAGGLPHGTWQVVEAGQHAAAQAPAPLPHGSW